MFDQSAALAAHAASRIQTTRTHRLLDDKPEQAQPTAQALDDVPVPKRGPPWRTRIVELLEASAEPMTSSQLAAAGAGGDAKSITKQCCDLVHSGRVVRAGSVAREGRRGEVLWTVPRREEKR